MGALIFVVGWRLRICSYVFYMLLSIASSLCSFMFFPPHQPKLWMNKKNQKCMSWTALHCVAFPQATIHIQPYHTLALDQCQPFLPLRVMKKVAFWARIGWWLPSFSSPQLGACWTAKNSWMPFVGILDLRCFFLEAILTILNSALKRPVLQHKHATNFLWSCFFFQVRKLF